MCEFIWQRWTILPAPSDRALCFRCRCPIDSGSIKVHYAGRCIDDSSHNSCNLHWKCWRKPHECEVLLEGVAESVVIQNLEHSDRLIVVSEDLSPFERSQILQFISGARADSFAGDFAFSVSPSLSNVRPRHCKDRNKRRRSKENSSREQNLEDHSTTTKESRNLSIKLPRVGSIARQSIELLCSEECSVYKSAAEIAAALSLERSGVTERLVEKGLCKYVPILVRAISSAARDTVTVKPEYHGNSADNRQPMQSTVELGSTCANVASLSLDSEVATKPSCTSPQAQKTLIFGPTRGCRARVLELRQKRKTTKVSLPPPQTPGSGTQPSSKRNKRQHDKSLKEETLGRHRLSMWIGQPPQRDQMPAILH